MGVAYGTRLQRLERLRERLDHEIAAERRLNPPPRAAPSQPLRKRERTQSVADQLAELGVTSGQVKDWAYANGMVHKVGPGRVPGHLVDAYAEHHRGAAS